MTINNRWFLCCLLLLSLGSKVLARKLRGTRTRRVNQDKLLFTEGLGRKGGDREKNNHNSKTNNHKNGGGGSQWASGNGGSYEHEPAASHDLNGGEKQKGETNYESPPMKYSKEGEHSLAPKETSRERDSKQTSSKMANSKGGAGKSASMKYKETEMHVNSYDDVPQDRPPPPHEGSPGESEKSKPSPKGDPSVIEDEPDYEEYAEDEYYAEEEGKEHVKPNGKEDDGDPPATETAPAPAQTPISNPQRHNPPDYSHVQMAQVAYVLSPFGLEYNIGSQMSSVPTTRNFAAVEATTIAYLEQYIALTYKSDPMVDFDSVEIEATSRRTGGTGGTPFIDYEASVAFAEDSPMTPTAADIGKTISEAFQEPNMAAYKLSLSNGLVLGNPFVSTTQVTVYVPDGNADSEGRVAGRNSSKMSAAGIAAAAGTGVLTLFVGGYLLWKIRSENMDMKGKLGKGYAGGLTLAGDTYDNCTLDAATLPHDDGRSLDDSYIDDGTFFPPEAVSKQRVDASNIPRMRTFDQAPDSQRNKIVGLDTSPITDDDGSDKHSDDGDSFQDDAGGTDGGGEQGQDRTSFASMVSRTRALVPTFKSSHMSNTDIKNYFKSKYKCVSPKGYETVDKAANGAVEASPSDDQSLNLVLPALDHHIPEAATAEGGGHTVTSEVSKRQTYRDYEGAYMRAYDEQSLASSVPSDEGARGDHDSLSVADSLSGMGSSVHRLVSSAQRGNRKNATTDRDVVPRLPSEHGPSYDQGETGSVERHMDDVSLDTM